MKKKLLTLLTFTTLLIACGKRNDIENIPLKSPPTIEERMELLEQVTKSTEEWLIGTWVEVNGCKETSNNNIKKRYEVRFYAYSNNEDVEGKHLLMGDQLYEFDCFYPNRKFLIDSYYYKVEGEDVSYKDFLSQFEPLSLKKISEDEMILNGRKLIKISNDYL